MKKRGLILFFVILFLTISILIKPVAASEIEDSIEKVTYQAEQYEAGNINYAQLIVYTASLRQDLSKAMGASFQEHDPVLKTEQLEKALGKPTETTRWVWVEEGNGNGHEKKVENGVSAWRKLIFDGKKMQIWLGAWPSIIAKNNEDVLYYRLNLETRFKSPEEQLNIKEKIEEAKTLAEGYSKNPSKEILENLASKTVGIEQAFNKYFNQNPSQCRELMNEVIGSENKRENQNLIMWEIDFYEGENFDAMMRFEMCDDCMWNWINLNMWIEGRGKGFKQPENQENGDFSREKYSSYTTESFKQGTKDMIEEIKSLIASGNYESAMRKSNELRMLTEAWNEQSNNVWQTLDKKYQDFWNTMSEEERMKCGETYCWIKKDQERRQEETRLRKANYEERKNFYIELFSSYEKKESYYEQEQWEKRLVEEFKERGEEICNNNVDDNENEQIDCGDSQCGGKVCGYETRTGLDENNQTVEEKVELYCIASTCQAKEEIVHEVNVSVCGNHICEENEQTTCPDDCATCVQYDALECSGNVIFSGTGEDGCPLEPVCLAENLTCTTDDDCTNPLCGNASCVEGVCQITELTECREAECVDGEEKINHCSSGEDIVVEGCVNGLWAETGVECEEGAAETEEAKVEEAEVVGDECSVISDCGNENDVCSNRRCVTIPQAEEVESEGEIEVQEEPETNTEEEQTREPETNAEETTEPASEQQGTRESEPEPQEASGEQSSVTGNVIFSFFRSIAKVTGFAVGDEASSGSGDSGSNSGSPDSSSSGSSESTSNPGENTASEPSSEQQQGEQPPVQGPEENFAQPEEQNRDEDRDRQREDERERRENECGERCDRECYDREVRPCVEKCIREDCGEELECNVDEVRVSCEAKCKENDISSCTEECSGKCLKGEDTWVEPEKEEYKEERFVFTVGGSCREAQGKTEGFIWFGGWAGNQNDEFSNFHLIKNKYYSQGGNDWCKEDLENLVKQRKELEKSLNEEFAAWFFEKYVANSAEKWEEHISGIFELYWRDVDLSRQITERIGCLNENSLPAYNLINFKYETEYGSVEFWEEIKTTNEFGEQKEIISPYMRTWLFPSREFFKFEMQKSMEDHELPGPEGEKMDTLSEEQKQDLRSDDKFMKEVRNLNEKYGENLVLQLKDFETGEIAFNVYMRINENDLIYFEPMPPEQNPAENVKVELDVNKLLDIIEFEESGRVELQSPPWDRRQETGLVKGVVDGAKMYFMFSSLMNSIKVTPEGAKNSGKFFAKQFFEKVMGGGEKKDEGREGPGGCQSEEECTEYCEDSKNAEECKQFMDENEQPESWENKASLTGKMIA
ncbi:MAG: hypothetical protein AABW63_01500 [Nanoarchaeota archaeon]|mgnify:CR=1 FL=1